MKILAFESSAKAASTALLSDGLLLAEYTQNSGQTHSRTLMQMAKDMLTSCDLTPQDIGAVAVAAGPGSFTGVRIGMACAKGFAWGLQLPLYGVSTLEAMTRGAAYADGIYCACMDARKQQIYNAVFSLQAGKLTRLTDDRAIAIDALVPELSEGPAPSICSATARSSSLTRWQAAACRSSCSLSSCGSSGRAALRSARWTACLWVTPVMRRP